ncbi:cupin domain-containing protein [Marinobacter fonticola]|uniref:cupin domain-containing protein n=1 Tax=Marinobacter fonticola TaxID=2603215 RepID=UPI0011E75D23|nr:cupin domain-containing protein [Marinobacter fonticola]
MKPTIKPAINRFDPAKEYFFEEGCYILEMANSADDPALSIARARVEPGRVTRLHTLAEQVERYVILDGEGLVEIGDALAETVTVGDVVIIPPGHPQRIRNTGESHLIFLALCTPRFRPEDYRDVDPEPPR